MAMSTSPTERRWRSVHLLMAGILGLLLVLAVLMALLLRQSLLQPAVRQMAEPLARALKDIDARDRRQDPRDLPAGWRQQAAPPDAEGGWPAPLAEALARQLRADLSRPVRVERASPGELRIWLQTARGDWLGVPVASLRGGWTRFALLLGSLAVLLGVALAILLARRLAAPVERLAAVAARLPEPVDPAAFRVGGPAEVALLGDTLAAALERMAQQCRDQDRLLAALSHDLRTPLMRLLLRVDLLDLAESERLALMGDITELDRRIDRFLEDARRGAEEPCARIDLRALLVHLLDDRVARGLDWQHDLGPVGSVQGQPGRLQRLLACLVDNAEQHGAAPFRAVLVAEPAADGRAGLMLTIDNAVPPSPRARAGSPRRGFGLALAHHVAQGLGGRLEVGPTAAGYRAQLWLPTA